MRSTTPSTRSSRRLRRAGTIAAAAAIALSTTFGLGIAPASAAPTSAATATASIPIEASQPTVPGAKPGPAPKWPGQLYRFVFETHWTPVARGGQNARSFLVHGYSVEPNGRVAHLDINECVTYLGYHDNIDSYQKAGVVLPSFDDVTVTSFAGPHCTGFNYGKVGGSGPMNMSTTSWTLFTHHGPAPR
jgi:hypothetical protein